MNLLIAISDSESNILAAHSAEAWGFKLKKDRTGKYKEFLLKEEDRHYSIPGNFITFWSSEKENDDAQGFMGLGIITGDQIPGKIDRNIWLDEDYYSLIPFKLLSSKKMPIQIVREMYGSQWNKIFTVISGHLPATKLTDEQVKDFIVYMLT